MNKYYILLFVLLLNLCSNSRMYAQDILDSLERSWIEMTDDSLRLTKQEEVLISLFFENSSADGKKLALATLQEARSLGLAEIEKDVLGTLALFSHSLGEIDDFNYYWREAYRLSNDQRDTSTIFYLLNIMSGQLTNEMKYDSAVIVLHQAMDLVQASGDLSRQQSLNNSLAIVFAEQGLLEKANIYFKQAADASLLLKDSAMVFAAYSNVARCFIDGKQLDSATIYVELAGDWIDAHMSLDAVVSYTSMAGQLAKAKGDYPTALAYFEEALAESDMMADKADQLAHIGLVQFELQDYDAVVIALKEAEHLSLQLEDNIILRDILPVLAKSYAALGNYPLAYDYAQQSIALRDEFLNEEIQRQVAEMQAKFELKELNTYNKTLKSLALTQQKQVEQRTLFALIACLLLLLIAGLMLMVWRRNKRISGFNQLLEQEVKSRVSDLEGANQELQRYLEDMKMFSHATSHGLKEPLRNISGFSSLLERRIKPYLKDDDILSFMQMIRSNANQMHCLIERIQLYTNMESELKEGQVLRNVSLVHTIEAVRHKLINTIENKQVQIDYPADLPEIYASVKVLRIVIKTLIGNGIKYNHSKPPVVKISYNLSDKYHYISITDNGIGIEEAFHGQIFEMFKRLHTQQEFKGTGMGLAICSKLVNRFGGDISLKSTLGNGSTFTFKLPVL